jgi:hypothetical protein
MPILFVLVGRGPEPVYPLRLPRTCRGSNLAEQTCSLSQLRCLGADLFGSTTREFSLRTTRCGRNLFAMARALPG